jgi:hypothetical protein
MGDIFCWQSNIQGEWKGFLYCPCNMSRGIELLFPLQHVPTIIGIPLGTPLNNITIALLRSPPTYLSHWTPELVWNAVTRMQSFTMQSSQMAAQMHARIASRCLQPHGFPRTVAPILRQVRELHLQSCASAKAVTYCHESQK